MGWFRRKENDVDLPPQETLTGDSRSTSFYVQRKTEGTWQKRLAVISYAGYLALYTTHCTGRLYDLQNLESFNMKYKGNEEVKIDMKTSSGQKLRLKLLGPEARNWAAKILNYEKTSIPSQDARSPLTWTCSGLTDTSILLSSEASLKSRFSFSLPLDSSNESLSRKLQEIREVAGKSELVHSILTDKSISDRERHRKLNESLNMSSPFRLVYDTDRTQSTESLDGYFDSEEDEEKAATEAEEPGNHDDGHTNLTHLSMAEPCITYE